MKNCLALIALALVGCAAPRPPENPANPSADFAADRWSCQQQVAALGQPAAPVAAAPTKTETVTRCKQAGFSDGIECRSTEQAASSSNPTDAMFKTMAQLQAHRANEDRANAWRNCMMAKGWR